MGALFIPHSSQDDDFVRKLRALVWWDIAQF